MKPPSNPPGSPSSRDQDGLDSHEPGQGRCGPVVGPAAALTLASATGLLLWLGYVDMGWWPLSLIAFAPLFMALEGRRAWSATLLTLLAGFTAMALATSYLPATLRAYTKFSHRTCTFVAAAILAYQATGLALGGLLHALASRKGWPTLVTFVVGFATAEMLWPWLTPFTLGAALYDVSLLTQVADLGGAHLVTAVMIAPGAALGLLGGDLLAKRRIRWGWVGTGLAMPLLAATYGALRIPMVEREMRKAPTLTVGLLQENAPKIRLPTDEDRISRMQMTETRKLAKQGAGLVVWSEESYRPYVAMPPVLAERLVIRLAKQTGVSLILGMQVRTGRGRHAPIYNSVLGANADGTFAGRYDKHDLFPFGETMPLGNLFPVLYRWFPHVSRLAEGKSFNGLKILGHPVATFICYEDLDGPLVRRLLAESKAELLVNLSNDAWFAVLPAMRSHLAMATFRAIEHRRYLLRATNTGLTSVIDPVGRVQVQAKPQTATSLLGKVHWMKGSTLYSWLGDVPWWTLLFFLLVAGILSPSFIETASRKLTSKLTGHRKAQRKDPAGSNADETTSQ